MNDEMVRWGFAVGGFYYAAIVLVLGIWKSVAARAVPTWFVLALATSSLWWTEPFGDWGAYVLYDPTLPQLPWGATPYTAPSKPWAIVPGYTWFYLVWTYFALGVLKGILKLKPQWNPTATCIGASTVLWFVFDIGVEFSMAKAGVWSYIETWGPTLHSSKGNFPLLWPLLSQLPFMTLLPWLMYHRDATGCTPLDRWVPVRPRAAGTGWDAAYDLARIVTWAVVFTVVFVATIIGPLVLVRVLWGVPSDIIP